MRCTVICFFCSLTHFLSCFALLWCNFWYYVLCFVLVCSNESLLFCPKSTEWKVNICVIFTLKIGCELECEFGVKETPVQDLLVLHSHGYHWTQRLLCKLFLVPFSNPLLMLLKMPYLWSYLIFHYSCLLLAIVVAAIYFCLYLLSLKSLYLLPMTVSPFSTQLKGLQNARKIVSFLWMCMINKSFMECK